MYLGGVKALQAKWGGQKTLGQKIGFEIQIHEEGNEDILESMRGLMVEAHWDGSKRRLAYMISSCIIGSRTMGGD